MKIFRPTIRGISIVIILSIVAFLNYDSANADIFYGKQYWDHARIWSESVLYALGGTVSKEALVSLIATGAIEEASEIFVGNDTAGLGWSVYIISTGLSLPFWKWLGPYAWIPVSGSIALSGGYQYFKNWRNTPPPSVLANRLLTTPGSDYPDDFNGVPATNFLENNPVKNVFINMANLIVGAVIEDPSCDSQIERFYSRVQQLNPDYDTDLALLQSKSDDAYQAATAVQERVCELAGTEEFPHFTSEEEVDAFLDNLTVEQRDELDEFNQAYADKLITFEEAAEVVLNDHRKAADAAALANGYFNNIMKLANHLYAPNYPVGIDEDWSDYPTLIIPSGGLYGLDSSDIFKVKLEEYVKAGGSLICLAQQHGYEFSALPGGEVGGYGWLEDQSCHSAAAYIDTYHQVLSGQTKTTPDLSVDGYFSNYPQDTTILLRRTANGQPCMIMYPSGQGRVIATTMYEDWAYGQAQSTAEGRALIRDIISWAKKPEQLPEYSPAETVSLQLTVNSLQDNQEEATQVEVYILNPDREIVDTQIINLSTPLAPGESTTLSTLYSLLSTSPLGIWWADYALLNAAGETIQPQCEGERLGLI